MGMLKEFKEFAMKGNVVELAVAVVIGAAFGKIVTAFVDHLIMPIVGLVSGGQDFSKKAIEIGSHTVTKEVDGKEVEMIEPLMLNYGAFLQATMNFFIVAFCVFLMVKAINKAQTALMGAEEEEEEKTPDDILLLQEIRDALKK